MIDNLEIKTREKAVLVGAIYGSLDKDTVDEHLDELKLLSTTAGAKVVGTITQNISKINPAFFIGAGKAKQVIFQAKELGASLVIFDDELSPAHIKNYSKLEENIKVIDRSSLILDIFSQHAKTKESKTQVELARLEYLLPRLTRAWTHLERQMGGIGTRAGAGETQIEVDRRLIRTKISKLKKELNSFDKERKVQSKGRDSEFKVSLAGYTNAGKSTLMKSISGADVLIKNQLFATLDTTTRLVELDSSHSILLSDTVGFVRKLPHHLVASFKGTLKEVVESDLILVILDASSLQVRDHFETITNVLKDLKADKRPFLIVLNKVDNLENSNQLSYLKRKFPDGVFISALNHIRVDLLKNNIMSIMDKNYEVADIKFSYSEAKALANAQDGVEVLERHYENDHVKLKVKGPAKRIDQIRLSLKT